MTELPPGWAWMKLGDIGEWFGGGTPSKKVTEYWTNGTIPWLSPKDMVTDILQGTTNLISTSAVENSPVRVVPAGSVAIVVRSGILERKLPVAVVPFATTLNQDMRAVVPYPGIEPKWVSHFLRMAEYRILHSCSKNGTTVASIETARLMEQYIPIPPTAEQRRIVATLEDHLSRLDTGSSSISHAQRRSALLVSSIRNAVVNDSEAEQKPLGELIIRIEAGKSFAAESRPAAPDEWGIIKVSAMTWGEFRAQENKAVPPGRSIDPRFEIKPGDILLSRANTEQYVGASVLVRHTRPKLLLSDKSLRIVPRDDIDREWLIQVLSSPLVRKQIAARATGTKDAMRNISQDALKEIKIPYVALEKQREIAARIRDLLDSIFHLGTQIKRAKEKEKSLRRSLLEAAFTGQLVPQNPKDEPASVLLERIKAERAAQGKPKRARRATAKTLKTTTRPVQESLL